MKLHAQLFTALLTASLSTACLEVEDPELGSDSQEGIYRQGIYRQGIYRQGIYRQGIYRQGVGVSGTGEFDGTLDGSQLRASFSVLGGGLFMQFATNERIVRSQLKVDLSGNVLSGTDLVGARWTSNNLQFKITAARTAPYDNTMTTASSNGASWEYKIKWWSDEESKWKFACAPGPDPQGGRWALLAPGSWDQSGAHVSDDNVTIGCSAGTIHKCAYGFGYKRWRRLTPTAQAAPMMAGSSSIMTSSSTAATRTAFGLSQDIGSPAEEPAMLSVSLAPLHDACVYAASAILCDDGVSHTVNNTLIDMVDSYGFNVEATPEELNSAGVDGQSFFQDESWFDAEGVVAANYERFETYIGEQASFADSMDLGNDCLVPRSDSFDNGEPADWLIKVRSDMHSWPELDPEFSGVGGIETIAPLNL